MFVDRSDAGRRLASKLDHLRGEAVVVLGLPRGGVPVAAEIAEALGAPLDVILVRKLGVPFQPELAMGAIGEDGVRVLDQEVLAAADVSSTEVAAVEARERSVLSRRAAQLRDVRPRRRLDGCTAVVVDDGLATGSTARAACQVARLLGATRVVLAVPVAPAGWIARLGRAADEYTCVASLPNFSSVGQFYRDFSQVSDEEVLRCLRRADGAGPAPLAAGPTTDGPAAADDPPIRDEDVLVAFDSVRLGGHLTIPEDPLGVVVFAHGSGSSRHSARNRYVAEQLHAARFGTLLFDLLTVEEEADRANVFDVELLGRRLVGVTAWLRRQPEAAQLPLGYFGASTGAAAALWAAAEPGVDVAAVVSRGGRPDLAGSRLAAVEAPTLFVVGGSDPVVLALNREARSRLRCENDLVVVPGATHLFDEPGTLDAAAMAARGWFVDHLVAARDRVH
jgi:putative phosphoribosyl transferase